jgi:hypothetical protein
VTNEEQRAEELASKAAAWADALRAPRCADVYQHGGRALATLDVIAPLVHGGDAAIQEILDDAREDLVDTYFNAAAGKHKAACIALRGVMEGLFMSLFYRQQALSLSLWASSASFQMVHSLFENKHEFSQYYRRLFKDHGFKKEYPGVSDTAIFDEAEAIYKHLSRYVHKSPVAARTVTSATEALVERVFKLFLTFLEREETLPALAFPAPATFAAEKQKPIKP